jgi:putative ABC transport system permease protein
MHGLIIAIKLAFKNLRSNIARTVLSLIGIVIGVASVILVLSLGSGVKQYLVDQVSSFGTDIIQIEVKVPKVSKTSAQNSGGQVGGVQITTLKLEDAEKIGRLPNVGAWYAGLITQQIVSSESKNSQAMIFGLTAGVTKADSKVEVESGRMFTEEDDAGLRQVAVIGSKVKDDFFGEAEAVGKDIKIKGQSYEVIGVLKTRGASGFFDYDGVIDIPLQTVQKKLAGADNIQIGIFKLKDMNQLELTVAQATDILRSQHDIDDPEDDDFAVNSIQEVLDILDKVFFAVNALLIALTSISLVVGGVGIMNVMYVSVTERTFEIGLKKSVGAKSFHILAQFLLEAIFLTFLGGILGLLLGIAISRGAEVVAMQFGFKVPFVVTWWAAALGMGFSSFIGIVFGYFPARKASLMTPMEALRKE